MSKLVHTAFFVLLAAFVPVLSSCKQPSNTNQNSGPAANEIRISADGADAAEPWLAADQKGNIYLVYVEHQDKNGDVYFQALDSTLKPKGDRVRVNPDAGTAKSWRGDPPSVTITGDGTILVGWTSRVETEHGSGTNYMLSASHNMGESFDVPAKINDDEQPASHGMHSLAVSNDGTIIAAWLDERNVTRATTPEQHSQHASSAATEPNSELFFATSNDGGKSFSSNRSVAKEVCPCCKTSLLATDDGRVYLSWRQVLPGDFRHISVAVSEDRGKTFSAGSIVSDDRWQIAACPVSGPSLSSAARELDLVWYTGGAAREPGYYFAAAANGDLKFGEPVLISADTRGGTPVLIDNGTNRTIVASAPDDRIQIFTAAAGGDASFKSQSTIDRASNPSAVFANGGVFVAFVRKEYGRSSIWVTKR